MVIEFKKIKNLKNPGILKCMKSFFEKLSKIQKFSKVLKN
jgi:hypothetical protein